jgi:hypothetical protein
VSPHADILPAVRRDVTHEWLCAINRGAAAPDASGLALGVGVGGGVGAAAAFQALLDLAMGDGDGESSVGGRRQASAQLYLALAYLGVDAPYPVMAQLAAVKTGRSLSRQQQATNPLPPPRSEPPYAADARCALKAYRDAVVGGGQDRTQSWAAVKTGRSRGRRSRQDAVVGSAAYWDHAYFLVAAVAEVRRLERLYWDHAYFLVAAVAEVRRLERLRTGTTPTSSSLLWPR